MNREREAIFAGAWHLVGTTSELSKHGDFVVRTLAGRSVQVRNFDGVIRAVSNVCAHRHALISSLPCGNSGTMRCQYHGWEYQADGRTGKIPQPKNFVPFDREQTRLPTYHVETVGQLVFVSVARDPEPIRTFLGDEFHRTLELRFSNQWGLALRWDPEYDVNWKVPVENSLEAYHVPAVHPKTFRQDPGPERSEHGLTSRHTWFRTKLPFSPHTWLDGAFQRCESQFVRWLGFGSTGWYEQHHVFPNLLFSFTDAISLCNSVSPTGPASSTAIVRQFGRTPTRSGIKRGMSRLWSRMTAKITKHILMEDLRIFEAIQRGLECSQQPGVLGCCEERIYQFQNYLVNELGESQND